jgi:oligosaccharide reducing-end xylanase
VKLCALFLSLLGAGIVAAQTPAPSIPHFPGDGSGAYATHHYRDLFAEAGHSPADTQAKIDRAYQQLFHGDALTERVYFESGSNANGPLAYMTDWANNDARTEGMSYGMMIAVQLNHKREFDALWNWSNTYMLITDPKNPNNGYFAWSMATDGTPRSTGPAPDGEEYYAMALLFAARRWGNGRGLYDYQAQANRILRLMRHHPVETATGPFRIHPDDPPFIFDPAKLTSPNITERKQAETNLALELKGEGKTPAPAPHWPMHPDRPETSGPMLDDAHPMVKFVPGPYGNFTDASYHLPAFYELFARWGPPEDRAFWLKAADVSRELFVRVTNPTTGLAPDRSNFDFSQMKERDGQPVPFSYDSWRTASNWSVDYSWWHKDPRQTRLSNHIQAFLISQGISIFVDRYTLDGKPLAVRHSTGMLAASTVAGLAATPGANQKAFIEELWRTPIPNGEQRYFDGMLYLMSFLHASGHFRMSDWDSKAP